MIRFFVKVKAVMQGVELRSANLQISSANPPAATANDGSAFAERKGRLVDKCKPLIGCPTGKRYI
ncbi:MAG TPA: hypothetical protein VGM31_06365 [Puia sp.]